MRFFLWESAMVPIHANSTWFMLLYIHAHGEGLHDYTGNKQNPKSGKIRVPTSRPYSFSFEQQHQVPIKVDIQKISQKCVVKVLKSWTNLKLGWRSALHRCCPSEPGRNDPLHPCGVLGCCLAREKWALVDGGNALDLQVFTGKKLVGTLGLECKQVAPKHLAIAIE